MTGIVTNELMYEVLKKIQDDVAGMKTDLADVKNVQLRMREDFHNFQGDLLRLERLIAGVDLRLQRVERRLELTDA